MVESKFVRRGDIFLIRGNPYILAEVGVRTYALVSLIDGNRWTEPVKITDPITFDDIRNKLDGEPFEMITPIKARVVLEIEE